MVENVVGKAGRVDGRLGPRLQAAKIKQLGARQKESFRAVVQVVWIPPFYCVEKMKNSRYFHRECYRL